MKTVAVQCPKCGKTHHLRSRSDMVVCDCWRICPICGAEMTPHTPDTAPKTYAMDGVRELQVLVACTRHSPPFYGVQKPVEVSGNAETA